MKSKVEDAEWNPELSRLSRHHKLSRGDMENIKHNKYVTREVQGTEMIQRKETSHLWRSRNYICNKDPVTSISILSK
jgi:hypothetical protein